MDEITVVVACYIMLTSTEAFPLSCLQSKSKYDTANSYRVDLEIKLNFFFTLTGKKFLALD